MTLRKLYLSSFSVFLFSMVGSYANGQNADKQYKMEWQKVEEFEKKGLPKSALAQVNLIYQRAKKDKDDVQVIKSLLYKNSLVVNMEEDGIRKMIDTLQTEIQLSSGTEKAILQSITAQLYQAYFARNRYKLYSVTATENFKKEDIATWAASDFHKKISELYLESLQVPGTKKISLEPFGAIIDKGNVRYLRPTLFDLLAHRALDYFKSTEKDVLKPSYSFEIDDPVVFADAKEYAKAKFNSQDSSSLHLRALEVFAELTALHLKDIKPLIDIDVERLQFAYQYAVMPDKDSLYLQALKKIFTKYNDAEATRAGFLAGQFLYSEAVKANHPQQMTDAVKWLEQVSRQFPGSEGNISSKNLLAGIKAPSLFLQSEKVNVPGIPFRTLVTFKNTNRIYLRILKVTRKQRNEIQQLYPNEQRFSKIKSLPLVREWTQPLPDMKDYLSHSVEINAGVLPVGEYMILASADKDFSTGKNVMAAQYVFVSNISYVQNGANFFALNRTTGQPLANATIKPWRQHYNYQKRKNELLPGPVIHSDKHGYFNVKENEKIPGNLMLEITSGHDHLFLDDSYYLYTYNPYEGDDREGYDDQKKYDSENARIFFFTDRSIYRPGQMVYYKGIGVTKNIKTGKSELLQYKDSIRIYLYNANNEKIDSALVKLNEYGSFNGKFQLPQNQLTGQFEISAEAFRGGSTSFSVEEYKRPKFFAEFEKAKETYRVGDTVHITGQANAYAGNNIDGAKVTYRVMRVARFLYPWYFWRRGIPQTQSMEITHGETNTDASGKFFISFVAIPDKTIDPKTDPVFDYMIHADVTDINGETRSADITVPVGYKALDLQIQIANKKIFEKSKLDSIIITGNNLSGESQTVNAQLKIYQLDAPVRVMRKRLWQEPDTTVMSKETFLSLFPHDVYRDENNPESWARKKIVLEATDTIQGLVSFSIKRKLAAGWYVAEATAKDRFGNNVKDVKYFQVIDPDAKTLTSGDYFIVQSESKNYQPGETAQVLVGTATDIHLIQQVEKLNSDSGKLNVSFNHFNIEDGFQKMNFNISENERGGFGIVQFFVKDNRFYSQKVFIGVPWRNKQLDISFDTYREKTLPGSKEEWKVTVKGADGQKVAAEMLASMYDASLDQFVGHHWNPMNLWPTYASYNNWSGGQNFSTFSSFQFHYPITTLQEISKQYDRLIKLYEFGGFYQPSPQYLKKSDGALNEVVVSAIGGRRSKIAPSESLADKELELSDSASATPPGYDTQPSVQEGNQNLRTNFNETVFFYPDLKTDKDGNITFSFTMPDALTKWKMMLQAHTKDLAIGYAEKSVITQKDLMVVPNAPRFFREGDQIVFSAKVVNMTDHEISGNTEFHLLNAATMNPVDQWFQNNQLVKPFTIAAKQSALVTFSIAVPKNFNDAVAYRIVAKTKDMSDGEEAFIPVVTNRMLVTESMPLPMNGNGTKHFTFDNLLKSGSSNTLTNYGLTIEYTPDPAWYAVQALPYLNAYPYECTEQVFNRYFANALAMHIANAAPRVKSIFEKWKTEDTAALLSNLQKNQELKSVLLEETPWVLQAKSESEQKRNIALLFDLVNMSKRLGTALTIVKDRQTPNGGFAWFNGGRDDRYITQYILTDMGHLKKLSGWPEKDSKLLESISSKALQYLDERIVEDFNNLKKIKADLGKNHLSSIIIHYLYARSFFPAKKLSAQAKGAYDYYSGQAKKYWSEQSTYSKGMIALAMYRSGEKQIAQAITRSLKETSIVNEELGRYWKDWNLRGFWWYQAPIESQALMIEVFTEVANDAKAVGQLKTWLLKNKQTNNWNTTKATAEAVYALLLQGNAPIEIGGLSETRNVKIDLGKTTFENKNEKQEAGTGYFKRSIEGQNVKPAMGNISVTVSSPSKTESESPSWGAVYWQYFEDLDKITFAETPLKLSKKLFVEKNTDRGAVLVPVNEGNKIMIGDKIKVRIELRVDRDMEYVHMKDMRASCMEPVNVLSGYKWQGGLGYYESTKDVSTNFFFSYLPKGTYVFEYPMFVTHSGDFSNGITSIQCMYAPEFTAHSEGVRVKVK